MKNSKNKTKYTGLLVAGILISILFIMPAVRNSNTNVVVEEINDQKTLDYDLVYNKDDYLYYNKDIADLITDDEELFKHFIEYGMKEGRQGSINFDVQYYRETNGDLGEIYGEDLTQYYIHYMEYGYREGRQGHPLEFSPSIYQLTSKILDSSTVELVAIMNIEKYLGSKYYIFSLPAYSFDLENREPITEGILDKENIINIKMNSLTDKYVMAIQENGKYVIVSNISWIENPEDYSNLIINPVKVRSKKGLQSQDELLEDILELNVSHVFRNLVIQTLMLPDKVEGNTIEFNYKGNTYYFNKQEIEKLDRIISTQTKEGIMVTASIINIKKDGFEPLYYENINMDTGASYYALNTLDEEGLYYVEAFTHFMSERYNGTSENYGLISRWVVGNEVNESGTYNYMGEKEISDYLVEYVRTFRVIYNIIKSNIPFADIYVPMEPWWGIDSDMLTYGGKEFLDLFNAKMKSEGNIDWGLAYHAYSFPLSDPKVLNDIDRTIDETNELTLEGYVSSDSLNSVFISMENIEVLTEYMNRKQFLTDTGEVRSIILSEQGYTSNSNVYGKCEALQAASIVYAYYKAEMNPDIDSFIYFLQMDNENASLGNNYYQFGLLNKDNNGNQHEKLSHDAFRVMDSKNSVEQLEDMKKILGISSWKEVIPNFRLEVFGEFQDKTLKKKLSITKALIKAIPTQKYTGLECLPELEVFYEGQKLINDIDYDVVYQDNIESGIAKALLVGLNQYSGIQEVTFEISH